MHNNIIGIAFKMNTREMLLHPLVEDQMQKDICQQRANDASLRRTFLAAYSLTARQYHIGL